MKISSVALYSLISLVGQAAQAREQDFQWRDDRLVCAEFNKVNLIAENPIFIDVDGSTPAFGEGGSPSVGDQVISNKFEFVGNYRGSNFNIEQFTIQSIGTFVVDDVS